MPQLLPLPALQWSDSDAEALTVFLKSEPGIRLSFAMEAMAPAPIATPGQTADNCLGVIAGFREAQNLISHLSRPPSEWKAEKAVAENFPDPEADELWPGGGSKPSVPAPAAE